MIFTRSDSGIRNYSSFIRQELLVYVEGKEEIDKCFDVKFYSILLSNLTDFNSFKIKVVGNKTTALAHFESIKRTNTIDSIVIIDRDLSSITHPEHEKHPQLIITYGYSWENDFWTISLLKDVICGLIPGGSELVPYVKKSFNLTLRRAAKISALDASCQINSTSLLQKNRNSSGVCLSKENDNFINLREIRRLKNNARNKNFENLTSIIKTAFEIHMSYTSNKIIRGHLCENIALTILAYYYKTLGSSSSVPKDFIKDICFANFEKAPTKYLSQKCVEHYQSQFTILE